MAQVPDFIPQTKLANSAKLVGHGLALLALLRDIGFRRIEALDLADERHGLNAVQLAVRDVVADDQRGAGFCGFRRQSSDRRLPVEPISPHPGEPRSGVSTGKGGPSFETQASPVPQDEAAKG
jgi:hypothetical protein